MTGAGNVGIGQTAPIGPLQIAIASNQGVLVNSNGNLGIGITNPTNKLTVLGSGGGTVDISTTGSINGFNIQATNSFYFVNSNLLMYATAAIGDSGNAYTFTDAGGSTARQIKASSVRVAATQNGTLLSLLDTGGGAYFSGNVGIGNTAPGGNLTIGPAANSTTKYQQLFAGYDSTNSYPQILFNNPGSSYMVIGTDTVNNLVLGKTFAVNSNWVNEQFVLQQTTGNIGICIR